MRRSRAVVVVALVTLVAAVHAGAPVAATAPAATASATTVTGFVDVPDDHPQADDIAWLGADGVAVGFDDGTFRPDAPLSRQAVAAWLSRLHPDGPLHDCTFPPFRDVPVDHPQCPAIRLMLARHLSLGYPDGTFRPDAPVSTQALATFVARLGADGAPMGTCATAPFVDVPVDHAFCAPIAWLVDQGVLPDDPATSLHPGVVLTRAAAAPWLAGADDRWWPSAVDVGLGLYHSCAVLQHGGLRCWGDNDSGQLGDGTTADRAEPVPVVGIDDAVQVVGGSGHTCALLGDGSVRCWGTNGRGQLGDGTTTGSLTPVAVLDIDDAIHLSSNADHTCAATATGAVRCWGTVPTTVAGLGPAGQVAVGVNHSCALLLDTTVWCWGDGSYGQLGQGGQASSTAPLLVGAASADPRVPGDSLGAGAGHTCARSSGSLLCWGLNNEGQIGDNSRTIAWAPSGVSDITTAVDIAGGGSNGHIDSHTCAVLASGKVQCWGSNSRGQLGNETRVRALTPGDVSTINDAVAVDAGAEHTCAAESTGGVRCWGARAEGQVGDGVRGSPTARVATPVIGLGPS